jgi:hypothetical protein
LQLGKKPSPVKKNSFASLHHAQKIIWQFEGNAIYPAFLLRCDLDFSRKAKA